MVLKEDKATRRDINLHVPDERGRRFGTSDDVEVKVITRRLPGVLDLTLERALTTGWADGVSVLVASGAVPYGYMLELCARHDQPASLTYLATQTTLPQEPSWVVWLADAGAAVASEAARTALGLTPCPDVADATKI